MPLERGIGGRKVDGSGSPALPDKEFMRRYPTVWEHMTRTEWEPGKPRVTSTLGIYCDDGVWKIRLSDRDNDVQCWVAAPLPTLLFEALEAALNDPGTRWRKERHFPGDQATKVRKRG